jgi:adenylosuccinate synthase
VLSAVVPEYKVLPGWERPSQKVHTYAELPEQAREYVEFIEKFLNIRVESVGVGPDREDMLTR